MVQKFLFTNKKIRDKSNDIDVFKEIIDKLKKELPDVIVHLRPLHLLEKNEIDKAVKLFISSKCDSLRSVTLSEKIYLNLGIYLRIF